MNKRIFKYNINGKDVWADPLKIERRFLAACDKVDIDSILKRFYGPEWLSAVERTDETTGQSFDKEGNLIPEASSQNIRVALKFRDEAIEELLPVLYKTFEQSPINPETGDGATELEMIEAYTNFNIFQDDLKKSTEMTPNLEPSTATVPTEMTTSNGSDSITTGTALSQFELSR